MNEGSRTSDAGAATDAGDGRPASRSVAVVDAPPRRRRASSPSDDDDDVDAPATTGAAAPRPPSWPRRVGRRIVRRPVRWAQAPWPTERVVRVVVTDADAGRHDRRDDERRPPQPAQPGRRPDLRPTPRRPAATWAPTCGGRRSCATTCCPTSSSPAGAWTGTPACRCTASTWWSRRWRSSPSTRSSRTAWRSSSSPSPGSSPCRSAAGRSAGWPASATRCRSCSPSPACASRSTRASASTAATSSRRWPASSRSPSPSAW